VAFLTVLSFMYCL